MIEPIEGLNNVEAIAAVEGVDVPAAAAPDWPDGSLLDALNCSTWPDVLQQTYQSARDRFYCMIKLRMVAFGAKPASGEMPEFRERRDPARRRRLLTDISWTRQCHFALHASAAN
jgi:hypothetical protein